MPGAGDYDESQDDGLVTEALRRLRRADLIPPVKSLSGEGLNADESVRVEVSRPLTDEIRRNVSAALGDLPHSIVEVSPGEGVTYRTREREGKLRYRLRQCTTWIGNRRAQRQAYSERHPVLVRVVRWVPRLIDALTSLFT